MSGIAVVHNFDGSPASPQLLSRMLDAIDHRAIDGRGSWIHGGTGLGYACMRTTSEELEETQPYCVGSGADSLCLVFDGRIDNRLELRKALVAAGAEPRGDTDSELILTAWQCWAEKSPQKIIGDFAYVIWDGSRHCMFCARDISGIRPLFYYRDTRMLLCGSELHQLLACPAVPREPNPPVIAEYMCATLTDWNSTLFRHLHRLPPAHYLVADRRGVAIRRYYDLEPARAIRYGTDEQYAEHFLEVFKEAVRCRLRALTSPAAELSGGLDSSSVVVTLAALQAEARVPSPPVECFSILYDEPECDERAYALEVARTRGVKCNFVAPTLLDYDKCLEQVRRYSDVPDYINGAVFDGLRAELVRRGKRVVLTGLGGDQWLQGSEYYLCELIVNRRWAELLHELCSDHGFGRLNSTSARLKILLRWGVKPMLPQGLVSLLRRLLGRLPYPYSIEPAFAHAVQLRARIEREPQRPRHMTYSQRSIYESWAVPWLVHLLEMDDRSNAWAGIEGRHPFYDQRVLEFSFAIPEEQRARLNLTKFVLRTAMKGLLPELVRERQDKSEFGLIFINTFKSVGGEALFDSMAMASKGWVSSERMQQLCRDRLAAYPSNLWPLWTTFAVELWFREVFANLANSAEPSSGSGPAFASSSAPSRATALSS
jgi:asparagine synthase (glutamine-hydrolysing)